MARMFYLGEIAALIICWLFYFEFYWTIERRVLKACSRQYIDKRCVKLSDRLFFTPVSGKARLGTLYYINRLLVFFLLALTLVHIVFGWAEPLQGFIRILTTVSVVFLGIIATVTSRASSEYICANINITSGRNIRLIRILSFVSVMILIVTYLYFAWVYL